MKTRSWFQLPLLFAPLLLSCATEPQGQLVLAFQTDVSLPKDIDRIRLEVSYVDNSADMPYAKTFDKLGTEEGVKLPATIGFLAPATPGRAIRVRAIASRGSDEGVRVMRDVITTVPQDRTALLPLTIEFLCDGLATPERDAFGKVKRDASGNVIVESGCPDGFTCKAGTCETAEVPAEALPTYEESEVYGGGTAKGDGTCFDTSRCFDATTEVAVQLDSESKKCIGTLAQGTVDGMNFGIRTQGGGICGPKGCFVALDVNRDAGWKALSRNTVELPRAICEKVKEGQIAGVVAAAAQNETCMQKQASIPTCGPWAASKEKYVSPFDGKTPEFVAMGQVNPVALALTDSSVYWTSKGALDMAGLTSGQGSVKMVPKSGGEPFVIAEKQDAPAAIAFDTTNYLVLWTNEQGTTGGSIRWASILEPLSTSEGNVLLDGLQQPTGLAAVLPLIYYTEIAGNQVHEITMKLNMDLPAVDGNPRKLSPPTPTGTSPRYVAAVAGLTCWTYENKLADANGLVACEYNQATLPPIATLQATPRTVAIYEAQSNNFVVYWANFAEMGSVMRVRLNNGVASPAETIANLSYPAGLAIDAEQKRLYITSAGEGRVVWLPLDAPDMSAGLEDPHEVAVGRTGPAAIALDTDNLYWIEEGKTSNTPTGAVVKLKKHL